MAEVGLVITADDKATAVLKSIGDTGNKAFTKLRSVVNGVGPAFQAVTDAMAKWNQVLDLGRKAMGLFRIVVSDNITEALRFRRANDPVVKQFEEMRKSVDLLRARIGDVFIPIVQGLADSFLDAGDGVIDFINANRKLIATNITVFLADVATILVEKIGLGIVLVSKAWSGWIELINLVKGGVEAFFGVMLGGIAKALKGWGFLVSFFDEDMAESLRDMSTLVAELGDEFDKSSKESLDAVDRQIKKQEELEEKLKKAGKAANEFIGEARAKILDKIARSQRGLNNATDEYITKLSVIGPLSERIAALRADLDATQLARQIAITNSIETSLENERKRVVDLASAITTNMGAAFESVIAGSETADEAFKKFIGSALTALVQFAIKSITTQSAIGAAGTAASSASAGPAGIIAAPILAAAMAIFIKGFLTKFQFGGVVRGGTPNKDSVPALLTPGEVVLTQREARDRGQPGGGSTVNVNLSTTHQTLTPPTSRAERRNMLLTLAPDLEQLVRDGLINLSPAGA